MSKEIEDVGLCRILLWAEVIHVMNIPQKTIDKWNKTAAPTGITREGLLVDTLIAKGWRLVKEVKDTE